MPLIIKIQSIGKLVMAIFKKDKAQQSSTEVTDIQRAPVPESAALQHQILQVTEHLPQYVGDSDLADVYRGEQRFAAASKSIRSRLTFSPLAGTFVAGTAVAGTAVIILSVMLSTPFNSHSVDQTALLSAAPTMDELALQDVILMTDEMAFATL